jgi:hypothetical protein
MTGAPVGHGNMRALQPVEVASVSNGARWGMISAVSALVMMTLALIMNLFIIARWAGRVETLMERQVQDISEIRQDVEVLEQRSDAIEVMDARLLQILRGQRDNNE